MIREQARYSVPYHEDNGLNPFGDYSRLVAVLLDNPRERQWVLEGPVVMPMQLTQEQFAACAVSFFFQQAQKASQ
jgi:hypothetical protein